MPDGRQAGVGPVQSGGQGRAARRVISRTETAVSVDLSLASSMLQTSATEFRSRDLGH